MTDITALESRITAALDRIRAGVETLSQDAVPSPDTEESALQTQLDEERTANEMLNERIQALKSQHEDASQELEQRIATQEQSLTSLDLALQTMRHANEALRDLNAQMRAALTEGVSEPEMINAVLAAELAALQAERKAESEEVSAILQTLTPLMKEA
jgi:chromosome segregation ATPase